MFAFVQLPRPNLGVAHHALGEEPGELNKVHHQLLSCYDYWWEITVITNSCDFLYNFVAHVLCVFTKLSLLFTN